MGIKIALDVGGTHLRYLVEEKSVLEKGTVPTASTDLIRFLDGLIEKYRFVEFIGISLAGWVQDGIILSAPNIAIGRTDIKRYLWERHAIDSRIENDLKCAAIAEYGIRKDSKMLSLLYLGSGMGSAFVEQGRIVRGCGNLAGEIGHVPYKKAPFECGCGKKNCLELFASGSALKKWIAYYGFTNANMWLEELRRSPDSRLQRVASEFYHAFSFAVGLIVTLLNPDRLILGGGIIKNNPSLWALAEEEIRKNALKLSAQMVKVEISPFENASLEGARQLEFLLDEPIGR